MFLILILVLLVEVLWKTQKKELLGHQEEGAHLALLEVGELLVE